MMSGRSVGAAKTTESPFLLQLKKEIYCLNENLIILVNSILQCYFPNKDMYCMNYFIEQINDTSK